MNRDECVREQAPGLQQRRGPDAAPLTVREPAAVVARSSTVGRPHARRVGWKHRLSGCVMLMCAPCVSRAVLLSEDAVDAAASVIAIVAIFFVPIVVIGLFLYVHVLPEKIAERRQHPQKAAIKTLCLLSLVFGGLLWPLAWLWAYSRPVAYKLAYGTEKHEDYFREAGEQAEAGALTPAVIEDVRRELDGLAARGHLTPELQSIRDRLAVVRAEAEQRGTLLVPGPYTGPERRMRVQATAIERRKRGTG